MPRRPQRARRTAHRAGRRLDRGPRRVVARRGRQAVRPSTPPRRSTPSTRSTSCTPRARPASPRASCTPPAATWSARRTRTGRSSTSSRTTDVFWTAADIGWVTGHSYIVYGPLANGTTSVMYEGTPGHPAQGPLVGDHREVQGHDPLLRADRDPHLHEVGRGHPGRSSTCRRCGCIGSVGEPINPEAYIWYRENIGGDRCPVVDTWWQTETGMIMISPLPGVTAGKPGSAMKALPGVSARGRRRRRATPVPQRRRAATWCSPSRGRRCCARIWGDDERYKDTYWSRFPGHVLRRRRRQARRGRRHLAARPGRRRDERRRATGCRPPRSSPRWSRTRRSPRRRSSGANDPDTGQAVDAFVILRESRRATAGEERGQGAARPRRQGDRPDRPAASDHGRPRAAEDPLRQDHAAAAARRRREPRASATSPPSPTPR